MVTTTILVCVTEGDNKYVMLDRDDVEKAYWEILFAHLMDGRTVGQLLTNTQKAYLFEALDAGETDIDLVEMPVITSP